MRYSRILGITQGDPNYILGEFISFTVDGEGHIYVLGWREKTVRKFDRRIFLDDRLPEDISTWHSMDESFRNQIKEGIKFPETMPAFLSFIPMDSSCRSFSAGLTPHTEHISFFSTVGFSGLSALSFSFQFFIR